MEQIIKDLNFLKKALFVIFKVNLVPEGWFVLRKNKTWCISR